MRNCALSSIAAWLCLSCLAPVVQAAGPPAFRSARPVWPSGRETEMNRLVGFRAVFEVPQGQNVVLRYTVGGSTGNTWPADRHGRHTAISAWTSGT